MGAPADETPTTYLADYVPFPYDVEKVLLEFDLRDDEAIVKQSSTLKLKDGGVAAGPTALVLDGRASFTTLRAIAIDGKVLTEGVEYVLTANAEDTRLTIAAEATPSSSSFALVVETSFAPQDNLELSGLYKSSGNFCTQCEAEGFRMITYYPDRPDVMSVFTTKITASKASCPVLLSNGNLVEIIDAPPAEDGVERHVATWHDPWRKPAYLFALVAGDLAVVEDVFKTMSGKDVTLRIYAEAKNIARCDFAMESLKRAMKWDEDTFGLEYDLDLFNIVAVDDFNMGAMENKSLNLFNSRLVLATPDSATDAAFGRIEGVIGHEYFHNWTGNRVTCRDWFQLSLKEGLTVFRDQEFSSDMMSRATKRIGDARYLRDAQFAEDASPMAHPVRPASYMKIDNFYTLTVYEKGAEVIRMYHTLLGKGGFRKGMDLYFQRHDGQAVTTDDFFAAMSDANAGVDISRLKHWYAQAGTPTLKCARSYDAQKKTYALTFTQSLPSTPDDGGDAERKVAQLIPIALGLVAADGANLDMTKISCVVGDESGGAGSSAAVPDGSSDATTTVLRLNAMSATFTFAGNFDAEPTPSILRGFSAPVKLEVFPPLSNEELLHALAHDGDAFTRWEAAQTIAREIMCRVVADVASKEWSDPTVVAAAIAADAAFAPFVAAARGVLESAVADDGRVDRAWVEEALSFPGVGALVQRLKPIDPLLVHAVVKAFTLQYAKGVTRELEACVVTCKLESRHEPTYEVNETQTARRALNAYALRLLGAASHGGADAIALVTAYKEAKNMTDVVAGLSALSKHPDAATARFAAFEDFREKWKDDNNVVCTYLSLVAGISGPDALERVKKTMADPAVFSMKVPNKFYALIGGFARANVAGFHAADGSGYAFLTDCLLEMDKMNAIAASRIAKPFTEWRLYDEKRQRMMRNQLQRILDAKPSPNLFEICTKSLA